MSTTESFNEVLAQEAAMSMHLLAGSYLDQGMEMAQVLQILHKAVELARACDARGLAHRPGGLLDLPVSP